MIRHKIRTGRDVDNNLYMQMGDEPRGGPNGDAVIGHICHGATARDLVKIVNRAVERRAAEPAFPGQTGADLREFADELQRASGWSTEQADPAPDWDGLLARAADVVRKLSWAVGSDGRIR